MRPTHIIDWDASLPLGGKRVLFCEFTLECAVEEGEEGREVYPIALQMDNGVNRKTGVREDVVKLTVPSDHTAKEKIMSALASDDMAQAFDLLFAYMLAQTLRHDEVLVEEII